MRRDLERGLSPWVSLLPRYLFAAALAVQVVALVTGLAALGDAAVGLLGAAVLVGLVVLTVLLVDYTTAPIGSLTRRLRGLASGWTSVLVVGFTLAWCVRAEASAGAVLGIELISFAGGAFGYWEAVRHAPEGLHGDSDADETIEDWPFQPAG